MSSSTSSSADPSTSDQGQAARSSQPPMPSTQQLEAAIQNLTSSATGYHYEIKDLEGKLVEHLGNFRAVDSVLEEALSGLNDHSQRAMIANNKIPEAHAQLDETKAELLELSTALPTVRKQAIAIQSLYESGRKTAQLLVKDLQWLNTRFYERWRRIIFTPSAPVSLRLRLFMRLLFLISFILWVYIIWTAFFGIVRAYRHRLLWGERLMS